MAIRQLWEGDNDRMNERQRVIQEHLAQNAVVVCRTCGCRYRQAEDACPDCGKEQD